jgi:hypothetical protein
MVVPRPFQAVAKVGIRVDIPRGRLAAAQDLDVEMIVGRGSDIGKLLVGKALFGDDAKIELLDVPALGGFEIGGPHSDVVATHVGERRSAVALGRN